jgi:IclR family acetate operon transcriptional repressor
VDVAARADAPSASTRAVERAIALLATVCTHEMTSLSMASRRTGVPASTALRLLRTLEHEHLVVRDEEAGWRAGPRLLQLAVRSLAREPLARLARPSLARLTALTGESTYLSVRGSDGLAVHVAAYDGTHPVRYAAWVGHTVPLDGSAIGRALADDVGPDGYVSVRPAAEPDVTQVSAPIRRPGGVVATLSIVGPAYRMDAAAVPALGAALVAEAARLEDALGAAGPLAPDETDTLDQTHQIDDGTIADPQTGRIDQERAVAG